MVRFRHLQPSKMKDTDNTSKHVILVLKCSSTYVCVRAFFNSNYSKRCTTTPLSAVASHPTTTTIISTATKTNLHTIPHPTKPYHILHHTPRHTPHYTHYHRSSPTTTTGAIPAETAGATPSLVTSTPRKGRGLLGLAAPRCTTAPRAGLLAVLPGTLRCPRYWKLKEGVAGSIVC